MQGRQAHCVSTCKGLGCAYQPLAFFVTDGAER